MPYIILYLFIINAWAFALMLADKRKAKKRRWRIRESTLLLSAALGGSIGALIAMHLFHHKTRHPQFSYGIPAILFIQLTVAFFWVQYR